MQIGNTVKALNRLFATVDKANSKFTEKSGVKCPSGCTKCCHGEKISASPLEFLPYAYHLYNNNQLEEKYWDFKLDKLKRCLLVEGENTESMGKCSEYEFRGLICRMFGNAASVDKAGIKRFSACSILKEKASLKPDFDAILQANAPVFSTYYMQLRAIDNNYGGMLLPVNMAILKSMEIVYNSTRGKRKRTA